MGNCIRKQTSEQWRDESARGTGLEMSTLVGEAPKGADRVTVKVSKKQFLQLLKQADVEGISSEEVLSRLMNIGDLSDRPWIPSLQSIPE